MQNRSCQATGSSFPSKPQQQPQQRHQLRSQWLLLLLPPPPPFLLPRLHHPLPQRWFSPSQPPPPQLPPRLRPARSLDSLLHLPHRLLNSSSSRTMESALINPILPLPTAAAATRNCNSTPFLQHQLRRTLPPL